MEQTACRADLQFIGSHQFFLCYHPNQIQFYGITQDLNIFFLTSCGSFRYQQRFFLINLYISCDLRLQLQLAWIADLCVAAQYLYPQLCNAVLATSCSFYFHRKGNTSPNGLPVVLLFLLTKGLQFHRALHQHAVLPQGLLLHLAYGKRGQDAVNIGLGIGDDDLQRNLFLLLCLR